MTALKGQAEITILKKKEAELVLLPLSKMI